MNTDIKKWEGILKSKGFVDKIHLWHWCEGWLMRKHTHVLGSDGSILEITRANEYIRIVASSIAPTMDRPFATYRLRSAEHPERPKTDFLSFDGTPLYMSAEEVRTYIIDSIQ